MACVARAAKADISFYSLPYKWIVLGTEATLVCARGGGNEVTVYGEDSQEVRTDAVPREKSAREYCPAFA